MVRRLHRRGGVPAEWLVNATPRGRAAVVVGVYARKHEARRAYDNARLWLCHLGLADPHKVVWEFAESRAKLTATWDQLPRCPAGMARWLQQRGWKVRAEPPQRPSVTSARYTPVDDFCRRIFALESRVEALEEHKTKRRHNEQQHSNSGGTTVPL